MRPFLKETSLGEVVKTILWYTPCFGRFVQIISVLPPVLAGVGRRLDTGSLTELAAGQRSDL